MKVLFLSKYYHNYLKIFFRDNPADLFTSYSELYEKIINDRYFWSDYFKQELPCYGYEVEQLIIDAQPLQELWARDYGKRYRPEHWYFDIVLQQINHYQPELLFVQDWSEELGADFITRVRENCPSVRYCAGYCGEGHPGPAYFKAHDLVISCAKDNVELFEDKGLAAYHIYHAFYPGILKQLPAEFEELGDIAYVGRINPGSGFHRNRAMFLAELAEDIEFNLHGQIRDLHDYSSYHPALRKLYRHLAGLTGYLSDYPLFKNNKFVKSCNDFNGLTGIQESLECLRSMLRKQFVGLGMFDLLRKYKMLLNYHISPEYAANLRLFEVTGMGRCLITDWKRNIEELFDPDREIVTYKSVDEARSKINYLLNNPAEREKIARAGQERTLRDHTYAERAARLHEIFSDFMRNR